MNGVKPISWQEINAWQRATLNTDPWLSGVIKHLSSAYVNEYRLAEDASRPSPLQADIDIAKRRETVNSQFQELFNR